MSGRRGSLARSSSCRPPRAPTFLCSVRWKYRIPHVRICPGRIPSQRISAIGFLQPARANPQPPSATVTPGRPGQRNHPIVKLSMPSRTTERNKQEKRAQDRSRATVLDTWRPHITTDKTRRAHTSTIHHPSKNPGDSIPAAPT